jgi:predicted phage terminase large subunit-like protein
MAKPISGFEGLAAEQKLGIQDFVQNTPMGNIDLKQIRHSDLMDLQRLLTPKMNKYIPHVPTPKQSAFLLLNCKEAFYGGAAGGGKSDALLMGGLQYVGVKGYAGIIFRKTYADLTKPGALIDRAKDWLFPHNDVRWNDKEKKMEFQQAYGPHKETISILQFGYLEGVNDKYNYQGGEYQYIGFDELTHFDKSNYIYMFSRLRRLKGFNVPLRVRGASNPPDDDSGIWVKTRYIDEGPAKGRIFIPAGLDDNPYLDKKEYEESLNELDPVTRTRLRDGNWEIVRKGNMFKRDWFQAVDFLPPGRRRIRYWDMAASDPEKAKKKNKSNEPDFTAGVLMSEYQGIYYIEDIEHVQMRPEGTEKIQKNIAIADGHSTLIREEQEPGSSGIGVISLKQRTLFQGYNYDGNHTTGDKATRAKQASAAAERGQIKYLRGCRNIDKFFSEAESFPGGIHDDLVDGFSGAFNELGAPKPNGAPLILHKNEEVENVFASENDLGAGYFSYSNFGR